MTGMVLQRAISKESGESRDLGHLMDYLRIKYVAWTPWTSYPLVMTNSLLLKMAIEIVSFTVKNGDFP